jgi:hypothetical protein
MQFDVMYLLRPWRCRNSWSLVLKLMISSISPSRVDPNWSPLHNYIGLDASFPYKLQYYKYAGFPDQHVTYTAGK